MERVAAGAHLPTPWLFELPEMKLSKSEDFCKSRVDGPLSSQFVMSLLIGRAVFFWAVVLPLKGRRFVRLCSNVPLMVNFIDELPLCEPARYKLRLCLNFCDFCLVPTTSAVPKMWVATRKWVAKDLVNWS